MAVSVCPAISTQAGTGVARRRLSTPDSRWLTTVTTRLAKHEATIASAMMPGT